jgi:hypothetical protein
VRDHKCPKVEAKFVGTFIAFQNPMKKLALLSVIACAPSVAIADTATTINHLAEGPALAIGVGWSSTYGNTGSLRLRSSSGIAVEPSLSIFKESDSSGYAGTVVAGRLGTRWPVAKKPSMQLSFLANSDFYSSEWTSSLSASWGVGVEWFFRPEISLSMDATSQLLGVVEGTDGYWSALAGPVFRPDFQATFLLYF